MNIRSLLFSFHGRASRLSFWVVTLVLIAWGTAFQQLLGPYGPENPMTVGPGLATIANLCIVLWIGLAMQVKRWHDRDKSGWWVLVNLVPVVGQIWVLIECGILKGAAGDNRFGRKLTSSSR